MSDLESKDSYPWTDFSHKPVSHGWQDEPCSTFIRDQSTLIGMLAPCAPPAVNESPTATGSNSYETDIS